MIDHIVIRPNPELIIGESFEVGDFDVFHMRGSGFYIELFNDLTVCVECERDELEPVIHFLSTNYSELKTFDDLYYCQIDVSDKEFVTGAGFNTSFKLNKLDFQPVDYELTIGEGLYIESIFYEKESENFQIEHILYDDSDRYAKFELRVKHTGF